MATIYEVSELAGVSLATVSRVINGSDKVSPKTRIKVEAAMTQLGYRPNSIAQSLASSRSNSVGVLVPEVHGPFFGVMLSHIEQELRKADKHVIFTAGHSLAQVERDSYEFLITRQIDALILHVYALSDDFLQQLRNLSPPTFIVGRVLAGMENRCFNIDNEQGSFLATRHLLQSGHKKVACISGPLWKSDAKERHSGFLRALRDAGLDVNPSLVLEGDYGEESGRHCVRKLIDSGADFTALACGNDEMAASAIDELRLLGKIVPKDISVIGFDNVFFTRYMNPRLSTVNYPIDRMGQMAARAVLRDVYGQENIRIQNHFEFEVVERDSVKVLS